MGRGVGVTAGERIWHHVAGALKSQLKERGARTRLFSSGETWPDSVFSYNLAMCVEEYSEKTCWKKDQPVLR